jgi:hypothetical protein
MEGYSQDGKLSQLQGQGWSQNSLWMICSQPLYQHVSPQMHDLKSYQFGASSARFYLFLGLLCFSGLDLQQSVVISARFFLPLEMSHSSDSDLQQSSEEGTLSEMQGMF